MYGSFREHVITDRSPPYHVSVINSFNQTKTKYCVNICALVWNVLVISFSLSPYYQGLNNSY